MKRFIEKHPFWFALGLTVLITILGLVVVVGGRALGLSQEVLTIAVLVLSAAVPLGFIWRLGWWEDYRPLTATMDGKPVGMMDKPLAASAAD